MIAEKHIWKILGENFKTKGFAHNQVDSFNNFINNTINEIITSESVCIPSIDKKYSKYTFNFSDVYIPLPTIIEEDRTLRGFTPAEARQRNLTYDANIYCTITEIIHIENKEPEITTHYRVIIGRVPIMLRSSKCYLTNMTKEERISAGECEYDEGGYFLIGGKERVLVFQLRAANNIPMVYEDKEGGKYKFTAEIRSMSEETGHSVKLQASIGIDDRTMVFSLPYIREYIPFGVVFKGLGFTDHDIANFIGISGETIDKYIKYIQRDSFFIEKGVF